MRQFNRSVRTLDKQLQDLEDDILKITVEIASDVEIPGVLRYWLYDEIGDGSLVIDYLAHLSLLSILDAPNIVKTVEHIWRGTYDCNKSVNLTSAFTRGLVAKTLRGLYVSGDKYFTVIGNNNSGSSIYYTFKILFHVIKSSTHRNSKGCILHEHSEKN